MKRYVEGENRAQSTLFPESLDDYIAEDNPVRVVDAFVEELNLKELGFEGAEPEATGARRLQCAWQHAPPGGTCSDRPYSGGSGLWRPSCPP